MNSQKVILIGLDGATWKNLMPWIKEGKLPFLKKIIKKGVYSITKTTIPCLTSPAIPSFYTGTHPTKTRTFGFRKPNGSIISSKDIVGKRFWDILGDYNINCFVSGLRTTYPPRIKKGVLISSILVPSEDSEFVYPNSEKRYFKGYFGKEKRSNILKWQKKDRKKLLNFQIEKSKKRFELIMDYLNKHSFDFKLIYFGLTDIVQHLIWDSQELILKSYKYLESCLKQLNNKYPNHNIIIFSDHGFAKNPDKIFYLNSWLFEKGFLYYKNLLTQSVEGIFKKIYYYLGWKAEKYIPTKYYRKLYVLIKKEKKSKKYKINIDPSETNLKFLNLDKTKIYLDQKWGLKIIKNNTTNYEKFRNRLIRRLKNIRSNEGDFVFKEIYKKEELYENAQDYDLIPDIIFTINQKYEIRSGYSKKLFVEIKSKRRVEGSHEYKREGIFMAFGPDIKEGVKLAPIEIYDIAPTILHMYNLPITKNMDGSVLTEIFKKGSGPAKRKVKYAKLSEKNQISTITKDVVI